MLAFKENPQLCLCYSKCGLIFPSFIHFPRRFYDISGGGEILIDGYEINKLNVNWLRSIIGVVSQEPGKSFSCSIYV